MDGKEISFDQVKDSIDELDVHPYYYSALSFIKDWLSGKEAFKITTSGSAGVPKEIILTRKQMLASAEGTAKALDLSGFSSALICVNTNYIAGIMMIVRSIEYGMEMTIVEPSSDPLDLISDGQAFDFTAVVPLQLENMIKKSPTNPSVFHHFKAIIVGGAPVSSRLFSLISEVSVPVYATYGMTETVSHIALQRLNGPSRQDYFTAFDNVLLKTDERGCLQIKSPVTNDEWITTNDMVDLWNDKHFKFIGRYDSVINSGGVKVHPERVEEEVEKVLSRLGIEVRFFIYGLPDASLGHKVCLFIESEVFERELEQSILKELKTNLPNYHAPKEIIYRNKFKETATGKVDRKRSVLPPSP